MGRLEDHQIGCLKLGPDFGEGVLDRLVLADGAAEHVALAGILAGLGQGRTPEPDGLGADQDSLRIETVQNTAESLAFLTDQIVSRDF